MANIEADIDQDLVGVVLNGGSEQVVETEGYTDWAERLTGEAAQLAAEAEARATEAHFAGLVARSMEGDPKVRFGYVFMEDGKPQSVMGSHTLTEMGEPGKLSFHYPEMPHSLTFFGVSWEHNHARQGNIVTLALDEIDSIAVHDDGHALFTTEHNDEGMIYVLTDQPFAAATAVEVAQSLQE